jgi:hypothetical protein
VGGGREAEILEAGEKAWLESLVEKASKFANSHLRIISVIGEERVNSQMRINVEIQQF